jgi:hypothetical protein
VAAPNKGNEDDHNTTAPSRRAGTRRADREFEMTQIQTITQIPVFTTAEGEANMVLVDQLVRQQEEMKSLQTQLAGLRELYRTTAAESRGFQTELAEEARLNGMGAEREADLLGKVTRLEFERDQLKFIAQSFAAQEGREQELMAELAACRKVIHDINKAAQLNQSTWGLWIKRICEEALESKP